MVDSLKIQFKENIFNDVYIPYYNNQSRFLHFWGGSGSGKSVFCSQKLLIRCLKEKGHIFLIARKTFHSHRHSTFALINYLLNTYNLAGLFKINLSDLSMTCANGNKILFTGVDDVEKLKSIANITNIWIEEATELSATDLRQINLRLRGETPFYKQIMLSYNPIDEYHFLNTDFHKRDRINSTLLKTTYLDNKFIDDEYKAELRNLEFEDPTYYKIYARGEWASIKGLIFTNWIANVPEPAHYEDIVYGLDFGFTNNPTALIQVGKIQKELYLKELIYETHLTNQDLISKLKLLGISRSAPIYCDSAEPKTIAEIKSAGFNAMPSEKDVRLGIDFMHRFNLNVVVGSYNLEKEFQTYKWKEDKNGIALNEPVKFKDHGLDGSRYAILSHGYKYWREGNRIFLPGISKSSKTRFTQTKKISGY